MKKLAGLTMLALLLATTALAVPAAEVVLVTSTTLHAGVYQPTVDDTRDSFGSTWWDVGIRYKLGEKGFASAAVDLSWIQGEKTVDDVEQKARMIPLTYRYMITPETGSRTKLSYGLGAGAYFCKMEGGDESDSETKFGADVRFAVDISEKLNVGVGYTWVFGKMQGFKLSGLDVALGYTF